MREIPVEMLSQVSGGLYVPEETSGVAANAGSGGGGGGGEIYAGALGSAARFIGTLWTVSDTYDWATSSLGRAGAGGNENDNGGTSYGIGTYNTFGG